MTEKNKIYKLGKTLGLDKKDIDSVLSAKTKNTYATTNTPAADMYKAGNLYGTLSSKELYKAGNLYGTLSPNDLL